MLVVILRQTAAQLFDFMLYASWTCFTHFEEYSLTFCGLLESASEVLSGAFDAVLHQTVQTTNERMNQEIHYIKM